MVHIAFDLHEGAPASVRLDRETFTRQLRMAAGVKWYELCRISQGRAAEIAGVSRAQFIEALGRYGVSPFQQTAEKSLTTQKRIAEEGTPMLEYLRLQTWARA